MIDSRIKQFEIIQDKGLSEKIYGKTEEIRQLVERFIHIG